MSRQKTDIGHTKKGTAEKMQGILQVTVMIKDITGQQENGQEEAERDAEQGKTSDAQGREQDEQCQEDTKREPCL